MHVENRRTIAIRVDRSHSKDEDVRNGEERSEKPGAAAQVKNLDERRMQMWELREKS